ncbi:MAG: DUF5372 family protein [Thermoanaerobaculia bacterium]
MTARRCDRSESRRFRYTAKSSNGPSDYLLVTHPFHPLAGKRVVILIERRYRSIGQVYVCEGGPLGTFTLAEDCTDRGRAPGPSPLDVDVLSELAALVSAIKSA